KICIKRRVIDSIRRASSLKHSFLNKAISIDYISEKDISTSYPELMRDLLDPESIYIDREETNSLRKEIDNLLSGVEKQVLALYLEGFSYVEIAENIEKSVKTVDNAISRIRKKFLEHFGK
ncbi:MAG: sigma-70 family RNA polymerase sigma factor, partial [Clostridiales bacterium]|nr:sigma-70 family RNA polymerase sigma factor [Clostridiales bacterium]